MTGVQTCALPISIAPMADTVIRIKNGKVGEIEKNEKPVDVMGIEW